MAIATATVLAIPLAAASALSGKPPRASASDSRTSPSTSSAHEISNTDKRAISAYVQAVYVYERRAHEHVPATLAAIGTFASGLEAECPGVLNSAPQDGYPASLSARGVGEAKRETEQLGELEDELVTDEAAVLQQSNRQALEQFAGTLRSLHWTNPVLRGALDTELAHLQEGLAIPVSAVCADMRAWVGSDYQTLSPATRQLETEQHAPGRGRRTESSGAPFAQLIVRYETPHERAVTARTELLTEQTQRALRSIDGTLTRLQATLGIFQEPSLSYTPPGWTVVGKGKTASGAHYEVLLAPAPAASSRSPSTHGAEGCPASMLGVTILTAGSSTDSCHSASAAPTVSCEEGVIAIEAETGPTVRSVRLRLSNDQTITSPVALVPPALGGPAGFYYQAVKGPSPTPVSLTELDAGDQPVSTIVLTHHSNCVQHTLKFLPNGIIPLAHGHVPHGPTFAIWGEAFRFLGRIQFALKVDVAGQGGGGESPAGHRPSLFSWAVYRGCQPHPFAVLYGVLKAPADTVLARVAGHLQPLRRAPIPAHLHSGGLLVYSVASTVPSTLIVRRAGKTISTEKLGSLGAQALETCAGEVEGGHETPRK